MVNYRAEQQRTPQYLATAVEKNLQEKLNAYRQLKNNKVVLSKAYSNRLEQEDLQQLMRLPFGFSLFEHDRRIFWNNSKTLAVCPPEALMNGRLNADTGRNISWDICDTLHWGSIRVIAASLPVAWLFTFENDYLKSHWEASDLIPATTTIRGRPAKGYQAIHLDNRPVFYIHIPAADIPPGKPSPALIWLTLAALFATISWVQMMALHYGRRHHAGIAYTVLFLLVIALRVVTYSTGLPFHIRELELFGPQLYATNAFLPSLGDLILNALCIAWILLCIVIEVPYRKFFTGKIPQWLRVLLGVATISLLSLYAVYITHLISTLVTDSNIPFDISSYYAININTFLGLFAIALIMSISVMISFFLNTLLRNLLSPRVRYILLVTVSLAWFYLLQHTAQDLLSHYSIWVILVFFSVLMGVEKLRISGDLFSPNMIFWAILTCICTTAALQYFGYEKERKQTRIAFAAKLGRQRDPEVQYQFMDVAGNISNDEAIRRFIYNPEAAGRSAVDDRIDVMYLNDALSKYQSEIYLFDRQGKSLFNADTVSYTTLLSKMAGAETRAEGMALLFRENAQDGHLYLAGIPVKDSTGKGISGYLFVDMALKRADNESAYPELLQPALAQQQDKANYASAIYYNTHLMLQSGNWPFPVSVAQRLPPGEDQLYVENPNYSELYYRIDDNSTAVVVYQHDFFREVTTLFSYLFGMLMLMNLLVLMYRHSLRALYKFRFRRPDLTLGMRIHYAVVGVLLFSFLVIGVVTVTFLNSQYASSNRNKLQDIMQIAGSEIQQYLFTHHALDNSGSFDTTARSAAFKYFITSIANRQRIDVNVFAADGMLDATSRNDIFDKRLLAPIIRPDAYRQLHAQRLSSLLQREQVERFSYLSSYMSLHNSNGTILGFVNVPYFSSEKELHLQISNILVALINLYAFIFILSGFFSFFIARSVTRPLNIIISQFKNINLRKNERLEWPHKDEIGRLVEEYNKMVKKLEENAAVLVQHEREGAWREMAKQIAHEIKNPLTPMKLNIQYLQNALANGHSNVSELAAKVSASIIEQIDNLSYIASEFSNFAKMPEARAEELELNDLLERAVELYRHESRITVEFHPSETPLYVHSDKSQLLRVCTNLLQNAVQAIDGKPEGRIDVRLSSSEGQALVAFADNGKGIPEDAQDKIFKPYFTTKTSGTGLGLAMTRKIIELWKGHIWFETAEGQGTSFYIMLPLAKKKE